MWINDQYCEDPNPLGNPKPDDEEVNEYRNAELPEVHKW